MGAFGCKCKPLCCSLMNDGFYLWSHEMLFSVIFHVHKNKNDSNTLWGLFVYGSYIDFLGNLRVNLL